MKFLGKKPFFLLLAGALSLPVLGAAQAADTNNSITLPNAIYERRTLTADVAEYTYKLRVGPGEYDQIGIHRVVKESAPNVPVRAGRAVFLAPGDIWNFRASFLTTAAAQPMPVYLAENGVDVWGIDYRWTFVPAGLPGYTFLKDWNLEQDARDLGVAIGTARFVRAITGSGAGQIFLLGWSRGGQISYAYLNGESQIPQAFRQVKGFIPADIYLKTDDASLRTAACNRRDLSEFDRTTGKFLSDLGLTALFLGSQAVSNPNGLSSINLGSPNGPLTNLQAGLLVGEETFILLDPNAPAPAYHFTGGTFAADFTPLGLLYSDAQKLFAFEMAASPVQPNQELIDADTAVCGTLSSLVPDDHLADIRVPVFYVGAGGGFGELGLYTTTLLGSTDVTSLVVHKAGAARANDYGHADLFQASDAQQLVWQPILSWLQAH